MIDYTFLIKNIDKIIPLLAKKGFVLDRKHFEKLDEQRKTQQMQLQKLQEQRNQQSKIIGQKKAKQENCDELMHAVSLINDQMKQTQKSFEAIDTQWKDLLLSMPNIPQDDVPQGTSEKDNQQMRIWGNPPVFDFPAQDHVALGNNLNQLDFASAAKMSGARYVVMKHHIAKLHRALAQFMLDIHTQEHGYQEMNVPYLVNEQALTGTGQLPKMKEDLFYINTQKPMALIPTAEVPLTNLVRDQILSSKQLPLKMVAHTVCFRSEAGAYGKDTHGMIRMHQFEKVELVQIVHPDESAQALEELTHHAEVILQKLNLPYRVMKLCTGDLGFASNKTYDLEVWLPAQNTYREISSCSHFDTFQARRLKARFRNNQNEPTQWVHTLNGSGLAVGRTLVAVLENYQQHDGTIVVPDVLQKYMQQDIIQNTQQKESSQAI